MVDRSQFSASLLQKDEATNPAILERVAVAKNRIQSVLDREIIAHQRTLEQKIADQGPTPQRVDPHLIGLAIFDLLQLRRLRLHVHKGTGTKAWYSNLTTSQAAIDERLDVLAPLYAEVAGSPFGNLTGDALEVIIYRCIDEIHRTNPSFVYQGHFQLDKPKNAHGRFIKIQPPKTVGSNVTRKEADFLQFGYAEGGLCIECKNYREWLYPHHGIIQELIVKAYELNLIPVLIHRRIHYSARSNFLEPAGIIAHETYHQYYPSDHAELAARVSHKRSLGFTDVQATEEPQPRTRKFFQETLPKIVPLMAERWNSNKEQLIRYARKEINLAQLYTEIDSPAGGKWIEREPFI